MNATLCVQARHLDDATGMPRPLSRPMIPGGSPVCTGRNPIPTRPRLNPQRVKVFSQ